MANASWLPSNDKKKCNQLVDEPTCTAARI
jgi:hypothetical protein